MFFFESSSDVCDLSAILGHSFKKVYILTTMLDLYSLGILTIFADVLLISDEI